MSQPWILLSSPFRKTKLYLLQSSFYIIIQYHVFPSGTHRHFFSLSSQQHYPFPRKKCTLIRYHKAPHYKMQFVYTLCGIIYFISYLNSVNEHSKRSKLLSFKEASVKYVVLSSPTTTTIPDSLEHSKYLTKTLDLLPSLESRSLQTPRYKRLSYRLKMTLKD